MEQYIGLDVSQKNNAISIRQGGSRTWRGKCASDPTELARIIRKRAPHVKRVVFTTGPLSTWFYHVLLAEWLPVVFIEVRHAQKILNEALNNTDANDADGLAQSARNSSPEKTIWPTTYCHCSMCGAICASMSPTLTDNFWRQRGTAKRRNY